MGNWGSNEIEELRRLYQENNVPSDEMVKDKSVLDSFTARFNSRIGTDGNFSAREVADRLFKLRKGGKLPRIRK
jgi:hypothetical protein